MRDSNLIKTQIKGIEMKFKTSNVIFSPQNIDRGTLAMLSIIDFKESDKVLDLGCGYGVVGILASKFVGYGNVTMIDIDENAIKLARENALINNVDGIKVFQNDGIKGLDEKDFSLIISNPPYHTDFSVPKEFIEKGFNRLRIGGKMIMVTKRKEWYKNKLTSIFGGVRINEIDGYFVFTAEKRDITYAKTKKI